MNLRKIHFRFPIYPYTLHTYQNSVFQTCLNYFSFFTIAFLINIDTTDPLFIIYFSYENITVRNPPVLLVACYTGDK